MMVTDCTKEDVMLTFEALANRLTDLDGMYAWDDEIESIRKALKDAGH
jgi:hypothetical protein